MTTELRRRTSSGGVRPLTCHYGESRLALACPCANGCREGRNAAAINPLTVPLPTHRGQLSAFAECPPNRHNRALCQGFTIQQKSTEEPTPHPWPFLSSCPSFPPQPQRIALWPNGHLLPSPNGDPCGPTNTCSSARSSAAARAPADTPVAQRIPLWPNGHLLVGAVVSCGPSPRGGGLGGLGPSAEAVALAHQGRPGRPPRRHLRPRDAR